MVPHLIIYEFNIGVQFRKEKKSKIKKHMHTLLAFATTHSPFFAGRIHSMAILKKGQVNYLGFSSFTSPFVVFSVICVKVSRILF